MGKGNDMKNREIYRLLCLWDSDDNLPWKEDAYRAARNKTDFYKYRKAYKQKVIRGKHMFKEYIENMKEDELRNTICKSTYYKYRQKYKKYKKEIEEKISSSIDPLFNEHSTQLNSFSHATFFYEQFYKAEPKYLTEDKNMAKVLYNFIDRKIYECITNVSAIYDLADDKIKEGLLDNQFLGLIESKINAKGLSEAFTNTLKRSNKYRENYKKYSYLFNRVISIQIYKISMALLDAIINNDVRQAINELSIGAPLKETLEGLDRNNVRLISVSFSKIYLRRILHLPLPSFRNAVLRTMLKRSLHQKPYQGIKQCWTRCFRK